MPFAPLLSSTHRITLVTTDPDRMAWVASTLQADGFEVAIDTHGQNPENVLPDLILFHVQDVSRIERDILHAVKANPLTAPVPILFLFSNAGMAQLWHAMYGESVNGFKAEPLSKEDLRAWVQESRVALGLAFDHESMTDQGSRSAGDQAVVRAAKNYVTKHHAQAFSVDSLAGILNIEAPRLADVFYASLGMTLDDFQTQERIRHAQRMLLQSSLNVSDIATAVGYSTVTQFTTAFRKLTNLTPGVYRRNSGVDSLAIQGAMRWSSL